MSASITTNFGNATDQVVDTVYVCEGDSLFFTSNDTTYTYNDTTHFINFSTYQWAQLTCAPFSPTVLPMGAQFASAGNTSWNMYGFAATPGLYLFTLTAICQFVHAGDTTTNDTVVDAIYLRIRPAPIANAGTDTLYCESNFTSLPWTLQLDGNDPTPNIGYWMITDA